jgi:WD40 repeat protein
MHASLSFMICIQFEDAGLSEASRPKLLNYCSSLQNSTSRVVDLCLLDTVTFSMAQSNGHIGVACADGTITIWAFRIDEVFVSCKSGMTCGDKPHSMIAAHSQSINKQCAVPSGSSSTAVLASCSDDGFIRLWTLGGAKVNEYKCITKQIAMALNEDKHTILAACNSHIELWNFDIGTYTQWQPGTCIDCTFDKRLTN